MKNPDLSGDSLPVSVQEQVRIVHECACEAARLGGWDPDAPLDYPTTVTTLSDLLRCQLLHDIGRDLIGRVRSELSRDALHLLWTSVAAECAEQEKAPG